jgi:hypothetical protein
MVEKLAAGKKSLHVVVNEPITIKSTTPHKETIVMATYLIIQQKSSTYSSSQQPNG